MCIADGWLHTPAWGRCGVAALLSAMPPYFCVFSEGGQAAEDSLS
jgi:hypothetical protein